MGKVFICLSLFTALFSQEWDFSDFDRYQNTCTKEEIEDKLNKYLIKNQNVQDYFLITDEAFFLFSSLENKKVGSFEYKLSFGNEPFTNKSKEKPCSGMKIALDPGHIGGVFSRIEDRYIDIPSEKGKLRYRFDEGTLAFLTAVHLKELLEKDGATVLMTRESIGVGAYEEDFFSWFLSHIDVSKEERSIIDIFRGEYNILDLLARAEKINDFNPDLTIMIHFNDVDASQPSDFSDKNYNMLFIPGSFSSNELKNQSNRYEFLRLLLSSSLEKSQLLSEKIASELLSLGVPMVQKEEETARYLNSVCLEIGSGIYCRNLALTRRVHSPLCYGETFIQRNIDECMRLSKKDTSINGVPCSSRLKEVAYAYYQGIKKYWACTE